MICLNKNSVEYQTLKNMSGLSDFKFDMYASHYVEKYGRYPELDELPKANSEKHLDNYLKVQTIEDTKFANTEHILEATSSNTLDEAIIKINNRYRDLETDIIDSGDISIVETKRRPNQWESIYSGGIEMISKLSPTENSAIIISMLDKLAKLYGIKFKQITNSDLTSEEWRNKVVDSRGIGAFIYNNEIYINTDNANLDAPIHEMMHLIFGSLRYSNPSLYFSMVDVINSIPGKDIYREKYYDRTNSDLNEEILVSEFSKYLSGQNSLISRFPETVIHEIEYNIKRVLDSMLFGEQSVKSVNNNVVFNSSLHKLAGIVGSKQFENDRFNSITNAQIHRIVANTKQDLIKKGDLKEFCN
jgi:hypothetical protein|nr:MAG TPA: protein of unknown function (DUF4157) [Bacteriophage sp.]